MKANEQMKVRFAYSNTGFCRVYYKVLEINGKKLDHPLLCCKQEDTDDQFTWYSATSDYHEPCSEIRETIQIVDDQGKVLRERLQ